MTSQSVADEGFQNTQRKSVFKAPIERTSSTQQPGPVASPHQLALTVFVTLAAPLNVDLADCEVLPSLDHLVRLGISLKHCRNFLSPCEGVGSALMTAFLEVLHEYIEDERVCFENVREQTVMEGSKEYSSVVLQMRPLDEQVEAQLAAGKPIARLANARLLLTFSGSSLAELEALFLTSPLWNPLRKALENVVQRMMHSFLKRWPMVFNRAWRQKIMDSWSFQSSIASSLKRIANRSRHSSLLTELRRLTKPSVPQPVEQAIAQSLCTLQKAIQRPVAGSFQARKLLDVEDSDLDEANVVKNEEDQKANIAGDVDQDMPLELDSETEEMLGCTSNSGDGSVRSLGSPFSLILGDSLSDGDAADDALI